MRVIDIPENRGIHPLQKRVPPSASGLPWSTWIARQSLCDETERREYHRRCADEEAAREQQRTSKAKPRSKAGKKGSGE